jgi:outer membrane protein assembly factor BamB
MIGRIPRLVGYCLVLLFAYLIFAPVANAQDTPRSPSYWQYAASSKLSFVEVIDVNGDGIGEILVLDADDRVSLLSAGGLVKWTYLSPHPISALGSVEATGGPSNGREIVLAGADNLTLLSAAGNKIWQVPINAATRPVKITPYDFRNDGTEQILLLLESGQIFIFSESGGLVWQYAGQEDLSANVNPLILVGDFDGDGAEEIILGIFTPRRFSQLLFIDNESVEWRQSISRRITAMTEVPFTNGQSYIAVGTNFGQVDLYSPEGELVWYRTVNKPISTLSFAGSPTLPTLFVGTEAGSVIAYSEEGRRLWASNLANDADRSVLAIHPAENTAAVGQLTASYPSRGDSLLAIILESATPSSDLADVLLLGNRGQLLAKINETDLPDITKLIDINKDSYYELLLGRFATLQLLGLGVGNSDYIQEWDYFFDAVPTSVMLIDLDHDGEEEVIVGTSNGRIHAIGSDRNLRWLNVPGEEISFLRRIPQDIRDTDTIALVRQTRGGFEEGVQTVPPLSHLELRGLNGELLWDVILPAQISAMAIDEQAEAEAIIILGTTDANLLGFDVDGNQIWKVAVEGLSEEGIRYILPQNRRGTHQTEILTGGERVIYSITPLSDSHAVSHFANFNEAITAIHEVRQPGNELAVNFIVFLADGTIHGLNHRGVEMAHLSWPYELTGKPSATAIWDERAIDVFQDDITAFLSATVEGHIEQIALVDNRPVPSWRIEGLGEIQTITWEDLTLDGRPDSALIGTRDGQIVLMEQLHTRNPQQTFDVSLNSNFAFLSFLKRASSQSPDLLAVTRNGLIRLFREEENRPPLVTDPRIEVDQNQLGFSIFVTDVENDTVKVRLEIQDPTSGEWLLASEQQLENGNGQLFWPVTDVPRGAERINYRYQFDDGLYQGILTPPPGPQLPITSLLSEVGLQLAGAIGILSLVGLILFIRQSQTPGAQAGRFYQQLKQRPGDKLMLLESRYAQSDGSPDFLLQLANRARRSADINLANLADGLFLLANRPQAGLPIITRTLEEMTVDGEDSGINHRRLLYKTAQSLLEAPTVTELNLLRPQMVHLLKVSDENDRRSPVLEILLPVLSNIRDSERVESINDRLVYLNQAALRIRQVQEQLSEFSPGVERTLVKAITRRWTGLLSADIEELRGRAELEISLKTKRLVPNEQTLVAMEIRNTGRAAAENIMAVLEDNPSYRVCSDPQLVPFLPAGRSRQIRFMIEPKTEERFRIALSITYDDRNRRDKKVAFGDMVHLLQPVREFSPIANPYLPGTPLRKDSPLFYGREDLFEFITENAGTNSQRNVLMLVGQRRTGKTSALLRLEEYLPDHLLPVYIDCQSLGVTPGMPALLQEFAWHIADTLNARGMNCIVPDNEVWQADPARVFQRTFLPAARLLLPADTTLLIVFDEFEAFESLVADGIMPPTVFTYLRHLMQHNDWLNFIFVGTRRLEEMSADYWSVLFNTALYRKIDFLPYPAATRLICEPVSPAIIYDDLAIDKILRVTAGHPYFLQLVCYTLVKNVNQQGSGYVTISDVNAALDEMLRLGEVHFAYLWQRSSRAERAMLSAAAHLMDRNEPLPPVTFIEFLETFSIELDPTEATTALNSLVRRDILREVTEEGFALYELRIGLVGLWVSQNKSLSRLLARVEA